MHETIVASGWDSILTAVPFLGFLVASFFRLDELIATPKRPAGHRRHPCGIDENGEAILCDPDGRRWPTRKSR